MGQGKKHGEEEHGRFSDGDPAILQTLRSAQLDDSILSFTPKLAAI